MGSVNKGILAKQVNGVLEYIYPKTSADIVEYDSNSPTKSVKKKIEEVEEVVHGLIYDEASTVTTTYSSLQIENLFVRRDTLYPLYGYYTSRYIDDNFATKDDLINLHLTDYYTKDEADETFAKLVDIKNLRLTDYYTKDEANETFATLDNINTNYYTKSQINSNFFNKDYTIQNYYNTEEVNDLLSHIRWVGSLENYTSMDAHYNHTTYETVDKNGVVRIFVGDQELDTRSASGHAYPYLEGGSRGLYSTIREFEVNLECENENTRMGTSYTTSSPLCSPRNGLLVIFVLHHSDVILEMDVNRSYPYKNSINFTPFTGSSYTITNGEYANQAYLTVFYIQANRWYSYYLRATVSDNTWFNINAYIFEGYKDLHLISDAGTISKFEPLEVTKEPGGVNIWSILSVDTTDVLTKKNVFTVNDNETLKKQITYYSTLGIYIDKESGCPDTIKFETDSDIANASCMHLLLERSE